MIEILKCDTNDVTLLASLAKEIWSQHFLPIIGQEQVAYMLEHFQNEEAMTRQMKEENYTYFKIIDGKPIGYIAIVFKEGEDAFLSKFYLKESARGQGYGRFALKFIELLAREKGSTGIWLTCNKDNELTIAKYKKMGFEIFEEAVNDIGNSFVMDDYYMRKDIIRKA